MTSKTDRRPRPALVVTAALSILLAGAAAAGAASLSVRLNLQGGYANRQLTACSLTHHYTFFHAGRPIVMKATVVPKPAQHWRGKLKVKQCLHGAFHTVWARYTRGHTDGTFKIAYPAIRHGFFFARAYDYGVKPATKSDKQYFRIP